MVIFILKEQFNTVSYFLLFFIYSFIVMNVCRVCYPMWFCSLSLSDRKVTRQCRLDAVRSAWTPAVCVTQAVSGSVSPPALKWCKSVWAGRRARSWISTPAMRWICDTNPGPRGRPSWSLHHWLRALQMSHNAANISMDLCFGDDSVEARISQISLGPFELH